MPGIMVIPFVLFALAIIQSLFGVGILLFGTPLLLMLGHEYNEALLYLLPASAALSWSQVWDYRKTKLDGGYRKRFFIFCLPLILIGMIATTRFDLKWYVGLFVTTMLVVAFSIRTSSRLQQRLQAWMRGNLSSALGIMGFVHGLSNMGGSILTPLVNSLYKEKQKSLAGISFDYAFMASFQLLVLVVLKTDLLEWKYLLGAPIALAVRYSIGKRLFTWTSDRSYQRLIDGLILANAVVLGSRLL